MNLAWGSTRSMEAASFPAMGIAANPSSEFLLTAIITYSARVEKMLGCEALVDDISKNFHFKQAQWSEQADAPSLFYEEV